MKDWLKNNKHNFKHGEIQTKLYKVWSSMKNRCFNLKNPAYKDYGGRGITICPEWAESYVVFRDWAVQNGYSENLEIDRIDNNGNYEPNNCRFISAKENSQNRRTTKLNLEQVKEIKQLYISGKYLQKELSEKYNISKQLVCDIINNKRWGIE